MLRLGAFLIAASSLAYVASILADSGALTVIWRDVEITLPVGLAAAAAAVVLFVTVMAYEFWRFLSSLPEKWREERVRHSEIEGYQALSSGMISAAAGDVLGARANARLAERLLGDRSGLLLLVAQTAQLEGQEDLARLQFKEMVKRPETELLGMRGLLAEALRLGDADEALELARRAHKRSPDTSWVLTTLFDQLARAEEWSEAFDVNMEMARLQLLDEREARRRQGVLTFLMAEAAMEDGRAEDALGLAKTAMRLAPEFTPAAVLGAEIALGTGRPGRAARLVEGAWRHNPHPELAAVYCLVQPQESASARLERFGRLRDCYTEHQLSHAVLGELALAANEFDAARNHLKRAIELDPRAGHYRLLADLERVMASDEGRILDLQDRALAARPDPRWVCRDTGEVLDQWFAIAPSGRFDGIDWTEPPRVATLMRQAATDAYLPTENDIILA